MRCRKGESEEGNQINYTLGLGVSTGAGLKDDSASVKLLGCGLTIGRKVGVSFFDSEIGVDLGKVSEESAKEAERRRREEEEAVRGAGESWQEEAAQAADFGTAPENEGSWLQGRLKSMQSTSAAVLNGVIEFGSARVMGATS